MTKLENGLQQVKNVLSQKIIFDSAADVDATAGDIIALLTIHSIYYPDFLETAQNVARMFDNQKPCQWAAIIENLAHIINYHPINDEEIEVMQSNFHKIVTFLRDTYEVDSEFWLRKIKNTKFRAPIFGTKAAKYPYKDKEDLMVVDEQLFDCVLPIEFLKKQEVIDGKGVEKLFKISVSTFDYLAKFVNKLATNRDIEDSDIMVLLETKPRLHGLEIDAFNNAAKLEQISYYLSNMSVSWALSFHAGIGDQELFNRFVKCLRTTREVYPSWKLKIQVHRLENLRMMQNTASCKKLLEKIEISIKEVKSQYSPCPATLNDAYNEMARYYWEKNELEKGFALYLKSIDERPIDVFRNSEAYLTMLINIVDISIRKKWLKKYVDYWPVDLKAKSIKWFEKSYERPQVVKPTFFKNLNKEKHQLLKLVEEPLLANAIKSYFILEKLYYHCDNKEIDQVIGLLKQLQKVYVQDAIKNAIQLAALVAFSKHPKFDLLSETMDIDSFLLNFDISIMLANAFYDASVSSDSHGHKYFDKALKYATRANELIHCSTGKYTIRTMVALNKLIVIRGIQQDIDDFDYQKYLNYLKRISPEENDAFVGEIGKLQKFKALVEKLGESEVSESSSETHTVENQEGAKVLEVDRGQDEIDSTAQDYEQEIVDFSQKMREFHAYKQKLKSKLDKGVEIRCPYKFEKYHTKCRYQGEDYELGNPEVFDLGNKQIGILPRHIFLDKVTRAQLYNVLKNGFSGSDESSRIIEVTNKDSTKWFYISKKGSDLRIISKNQMKTPDGNTYIFFDLLGNHTTLKRFYQEGLKVKDIPYDMGDFVDEQDYQDSDIISDSESDFDWEEAPQDSSSLGEVNTFVDEFN